MGLRIPPEIFSTIQLAVRQIHEKSALLSKMKFTYGKPMRGGEAFAPYSRAGLEKDINQHYSSIEGAYTKIMEYGAEQMRERTAPRYKR